MKMFKSILFFSIVLFLGTIMSGCEGPVGPVGPAGSQGTQGSAGPVGNDGNDGNANVTVISLKKADINWVSGSYLGTTSNVYELGAPEVNQDILDHGTVLGYCLISSDWMPLPFIWENTTGSSRQYILYNYSLEKIKLFAYQTSGVLNPGSVSEYRFMLITDNTVTSGRISSVESVQDRLNDAGVDINNYFEVCQYFGIDPN